MKLLLCLLLTGCVSDPVTWEHWMECEDFCADAMLVEACVKPWSGRGCLCDDGRIGFFKGEIVSYEFDEIYD